MTLTLILMALKITLILTVVIMIVWVWSRATIATRLFGIGLISMFAIQLFRPQISSFFLISVGSDLWTLLECLPLGFFIAALYSEFSWRVAPKKRKK